MNDDKKKKTFFEKINGLSFESRVTISFTLIFAVLSTLLCVTIFVSVSDLYLDNSVNGVVSDFERIETYLSRMQGDGEIDVHLLMQYLDDKETDFKITDYTLGDYVGNFENTHYFTSSDPVIITGTIHTSRYVVKTVNINGRTYAVMQNRMDINGRKYTVETVRGIKLQNLRYRTTIARMVAFNILAVAFVLYYSRRLSRFIFAPVERVRLTAEKITALDLSKRIDAGQGDARMQNLVDTFNSMLERLEVSFKNQSQFISDVSHELKTPLSVIDGYINLMRRWGDKHPEIMDEGIDNISHESEHMSHIMKNLLFLARSEQGKIQAEMHNINPSGAVAEVIEEIKIIYPQMEIEFKRNSEDEIFADFNMLKQLLWIYADNSVKYTSHKGHLIFTTERILDRCIITVEDNGRGIKTEDIPYVFNRAFRSESAENKIVEGSGLGLFIAKELVESFGGTVRAQSEPFVRTAFINSFPVYKKK